MSKYFSNSMPAGITVPQVTAGMGSSPTAAAAVNEKKKKKQDDSSVDHDAGIGNWGQSDAELFGSGGE